MLYFDFANSYPELWGGSTDWKLGEIRKMLFSEGRNSRYSNCLLFVGGLRGEELTFSVENSLEGKFRNEVFKPGVLAWI